MEYVFNNLKVEGDSELVFEKENLSYGSLSYGRPTELTSVNSEKEKCNICIVHCIVYKVYLNLKS